jgi:hypothetical protein
VTVFAMQKQHLSTDKPPKDREDKLDKALSDSFPTSDPPSHSPGIDGPTKRPQHNATGAPKPHKTKRPKR